MTGWRAYGPQQAKWLGELSRDMFGVAGSLDGDRAIVGASRNPGVTPTKLGAAYIYERRTDGTWPAAGVKLGASDGFLNDQFGIAVSLSGDRALVGAGARRGAYVFARQSDGGWTEEQILTVTGQTTDQFARAVSLSGDRALVGASQDADRGTNAGAVYVFNARRTAPGRRRRSCTRQRRTARTRSASRWRSRVTVSWSERTRGAVPLGEGPARHISSCTTPTEPGPPPSRSRPPPAT